MLSEIHITPLLAKGYHHAAMHFSPYMRLLAELLEQLRTNMYKQPYFEVWKKIELSREKFDLPEVKQFAKWMRMQFNEVVITEMKKAIEANTRTSPAAGYNKWHEYYIESLTNWWSPGYLSLPRESFGFEERYNEQINRFKKLNRLILEDRWIDAYPCFIELLQDKELSKRERAYLLVIAGRIELRYLLDYKDPLPHLKAAAELLPECAWIERSYAEHDIKLGNYAAARDKLNRIIRYDDRDPETYLVMGDAYRQDQKKAVAEQYYYDAMNLNFLDTGSYLRLINLYADGDDLKDKQSAIPDLVQQVELLEANDEFSNSVVSAYRELILFYSRQNEVEKTQQYITSIQNSYPDLIYAYIDSAYLLIEKKNLGEARVQLDKAMKLDDSAYDVHFAYAWLEDQSGNPELAIEHYLECKKVRPLFGDILHNYIAVVYDIQQDFNQAIDNYREAIRINANNSLYHSNLGLAFKKIERFQEAEQSLQRAIELNPTVAQYHNDLGNVYYAQSKWREAQKCYEAAIQYDNSEAVYYENLGLASSNLSDFKTSQFAYTTAAHMRPCKENFNLAGIACYNLGENEKAVDFYSKAIKIDGNDAVYFNNVGLAYKNDRKFVESLEAFNKAIELDPENHQYRNRLGETYFAAAQFDKAIEAYKKALQLNNYDANVYENLGLAYESLGDADAAEKTYQLMLEKGNYGARYINRLGVFFYNQSRFEKAITEYQKAIELDKENVVYMENLGLAYEYLGDLAMAEKYYRMSCEMLPGRPDAHLRLAAILDKSGNSMQAIEVMQNVLDIDPENVEHLKTLGVYQEKAGQDAEALTTYKQALTFEPESEYLNNRAGIMCYRSGDHQEAIRYYQLAVISNPTAGVYHSNIALCYDELGQKEMALEEFQKAVELDPSSSHYNYLGVAYHNNQDYANAINCYLKAIALEPGNPQYYSNLGLAYLLEGLYEESEIEFLKALELLPNDASNNNNLGVLYTYRGQYEESLAYFKKAIELDPYYEDAYNNLAISFMSIGETAQALSVCEEGLLKIQDSQKLMEKKTEILDLLIE